MVRRRWKIARVVAPPLLLAGLVVAAGSTAFGSVAGAAGPSGSTQPAATSVDLPSDETAVCGAPGAGTTSCNAIQLQDPTGNWVPRPSWSGPTAPIGGPNATVSPPDTGFFPADLLSAYGLASAAASMIPGSTAPTIAIVGAYDDPTAESDLAVYRSAMSGATDRNTGLTDAAIPPLCSGSTTTGCVTFTKVNQTGGTSYPAGNAGWGEEISLDLDMASSICPDCNILLVEATSNSYADLADAVAEAKTFHPVVISNSYGGSEETSETEYNSDCASTATTAVTVATGDDGYGVEFSSSAPGVTAAAGTSLTYSGSGTGLTWNPQTVWDDAGSGCSSVEPMPSWQDDQGVYSNSADCKNREVGDVSAVANPSTGVAVYDSDGESGWLVFGGTSVSTQIIGATYGVAAGTGTINPSASAFYPDSTSAGTGPTPGLVPVSSGSNGSCGNYLCNAADSLSSGYNGPAGLGTPDGPTAFTASSTLDGSLSFSTSSLSLAAGTAGAVTLELSATETSPVDVSLSTTSAGGGFSTSSTGPFTSSTTLSIPSGTTSEVFYYEDTVAGSPTISAKATGWSPGSLTATITAGPLAKITVSPASASLAEGASQVFAASGTDDHGNAVSIDPSWTTTAPGTDSPSSGTSTTFKAGSSSGSGTVTATQGTVSGSASITVNAEPSMKVAIAAGTASHEGDDYDVPLTVTAANASTGASLSGASVTVDVRSGTTCSGSVVTSGKGTTGRTGSLSLTVALTSTGSWCASAAVTDSGYGAGSASTTFSISSSTGGRGTGGGGRGTSGGGRETGDGSVRQ